MLRGQFVTIALQGEYGKPRPGLIVQAASFSKHPSIVVCPVSSAVQIDMDEFRVDLAPSAKNGLRVASQIMIDKVVALPRSKIGKLIGEADDELMERVTRKLAVLLGIK
jgi:mRNA interferase MazF